MNKENRSVENAIVAEQPYRQDSMEK